MALTVWLAEEARRGDAEERARLLHRFDGVDLFVVFSRNQIPILEELGIERDRIASVPYGVDTDFFDAEPGGDRDIDVLTVGRDWGRDYDVLFDAVAGTELVVDVVCPIDQLPAQRPDMNLRLHGRVDSRTCAEMLARAKVVVVPTKDFAYPTGQSVSLEAAASGCCVIVTGTVPMQEYFTHEETALLVPPGDPEALLAAIRRAIADPNLRFRVGQAARARIRSAHSTNAMWSAVVTRLRDLGYMGEQVDLDISRVE